MPKFPRFTSGTFGRLDFATMNDLFDRVEQLEASLRMQDAASRHNLSELVLCNVTAIISSSGSCKQAKWTEYTYASDVCAAPKTGGSRGSTGPGGDSDYPLVGEDLVVGQTYLAHAAYNEDGKLIYKQIKTGGSTVGDFFFARITGAEAYPAYNDVVYRWKYSWTEVYYTLQTPGVNFVWLDVPNGRNSSIQSTGRYATNTLEQDGIVGVGGSGPSAAQESPARIANGQVVILFFPPVNFSAYFSAGPGLNVNCI